MCWPHRMGIDGLVCVEADGYEVVCLACSVVSADVAHRAVDSEHGASCSAIRAATPMPGVAHSITALRTCERPRLGGPGPLDDCRDVS